MFKKLVDLKENKKNIEIYGTETVEQSFIDSCKKHGITPLAVKEDGTIISGHKRYQAALKLGKQEVEVFIVKYDNELDELEALINFNDQREKTVSQKLNEGEKLEFIEKERAKVRMKTDAIFLEKNTGVEMFPQADKGTKTRDIVAKKVDLGSGKTYEKAKEVKKQADAGNVKAKEVLKKIDSGEKTINAGFKELKLEKQQEEKKERESKGSENFKSNTDKFVIYNRDLTDCILDKKVDVIITDPPYPKEFIDCFNKLSLFAKRNLKQGGLLICLTGQCYLPEYITHLSEHLTYHWMACLNTPDKSCQIFPKKVFTNWKPILIFSNGEYTNKTWMNDVYSSEYVERTDHKWQQGEVAFNSLVKKFSEKGEIVCDPFMGSGTTGISAISQDRFFIGLDIEKESYETSLTKLNNYKGT